MTFQQTKILVHTNHFSVPRRSIFSLYMIIPDGVHVIMQKFGADVSDGITAGLHILPPWYRVAFLVSKQSASYNAPVYVHSSLPPNPPPSI